MQQEKRFDKNTLVAFILMGALLLGYFYLNQPSKEELKEQERQEQLAKETAEKTKDSLALNQTQDSVSIQKDSAVVLVEAKDFELENEKFKVKFSGKGGGISQL